MGCERLLIEIETQEIKCSLSSLRTSLREGVKWTNIRNRSQNAWIRAFIQWHRWYKKIQIEHMS